MIETMLSHRCAFCGNQTHLTPKYGFVVERIEGSNYRHMIEVAAQCDACSRINVARGVAPPNNQWRSPLGEVDVNLKAWAENMTDTTWSPPSMVQADTEYLPLEIAGFYQEAQDAFSIGAFRAVLLLARSVIEATAKVNGSAGGNLFSKIDSMHTEGLIRPGTRKVAHALRVLGNDMAHGDLGGEPTLEDAEDVLKLLRMVLDDVYVGEAMTNDILSRRAGE